jgi:ribosomal protein S18 acetylase RimI-like enzyme
MEIRRAKASDWAAVWAIFQEVVQKGDSFVYDAAISEEDALTVWMHPPVIPYVAVEGETVLGSYMLRPNQPGRGSHVANAGFMVAAEYGGRGIGRAMGVHALHEARAAGYRAMQFNFVVSTNERAVALWRSLGFAIVGTVPQAFAHPHHGLVDVHILHQML